MDSFDAMMAALPVEMIAVASKSAFGALVAFGVNKLAAYSTSKALERKDKESKEAKEGKEASAAAAAPSSSSSANFKSKLKEFNRLQFRLASMLSSITPAAGLLEVAAARGNTLLDPVVSMIRSTREEVEALTSRVEAALVVDRISPGNAEEEAELDAILQLIQPLLDNLESLVPLLQLNLAASGLSVSTAMPSSASLSRTLNASRMLCKADDTVKKLGEWQLVSTYEGTVYTLFEAHARTGPGSLPGTPAKTPAATAQSKVNWTWQEKFRRADLSLFRRKAADSIDFELRIIQNLDDGLAHDDEEKRLELVYPLPCLRKLYLATSSALLNLDEEKGDPVLLLRMEGEGVVEAWIAVGEYDGQDGGEDDEESSSGDENHGAKSKAKGKGKSAPLLSSRRTPGASLSEVSLVVSLWPFKAFVLLTKFRPSLQQLEHLLRLSQLEATTAKSHLLASDEQLCLFLSSTTATEAEAPVHTPSSKGTPWKTPQSAKVERSDRGGESPLASRSRVGRAATLAGTERVRRMNKG